MAKNFYFFGTNGSGELGATVYVGFSKDQGAFLHYAGHQTLISYKVYLLLIKQFKTSYRCYDHTTKSYWAFLKGI